MGCAEQGYHLPCKLLCALTGQQDGFSGEVSHGVAQGVGEVGGVVHRGVVELDVDGVVLLVVVAANDSDRIPHLAEGTTHTQTNPSNQMS